MTAPVEAKNLEGQLLHALRFSGLEREHLADIVNTIVSINTTGVTVHGVNTYGRPAIEGVTVRTNLNIASIELLGKILNAHPNINNVIIFPRGIPAVSQVAAEINVG